MIAKQSGSRKTHYVIITTLELTLSAWMRTRENANEAPHPYSRILKAIVWDSKGKVGE